MEFQQMSDYVSVPWRALIIPSQGSRDTNTSTGLCNSAKTIVSCRNHYMQLGYSVTRNVFFGYSECR